MKALFFVLSVVFGIQMISVAQYEHRLDFSSSAAADTCDAVHYRIHLQQIDFTAKTIQAKTIVRLRPKVNTTIIPLELKALQVSSVKRGQQDLVFTQSGNRLGIQMGTTVHPTDTLELEITYGGAPFHESWGGFHFSGNYAFNLGVGFESDPHNLGKAWFPCVDDFQDRATYDVLITLPEAMTGVGGGILADTTHHANGTITWEWQIRQPIPTYLVSAAAGNYVVKKYDLQSLNGILPAAIYTRPIDSGKVNNTFAHLQDIVNIFENRFGPYPFDRVGYVGTALGAMEHVGNIAFPHSSISGNLSNEYLLAHELSHMWFGNQVTCADAGDMWLNEGWATFCHYFFKYDLYGPNIYRNEMNVNHLDILKNAHITDGSYLPLHDVPTNYTYGTTVYDKGSTVVHTLMNYLGQEVFFDAIKAYLQQFSYHHASSYDLQDFLTSYTGTDMQPFFDAWVFTAGTPHFSIDSTQVIPQNGQFKVKLFMKQKHKGVSHISTKNIIEVGFMDDNWQIHTDTIHFDGPTDVTEKTLSFAPLLTLADPFDKTADATTDFSGVLRTVGETNYTGINFKLMVDALPDSAFYRVTHHWAAPDSLKQAVAGLRLSPYRHWQLCGIFPEGTQMRGRFFYSNSNSLDGSLILTEQDSAVILYRTSPASDWTPVSQFREGFWNIGYITVNDLKPGQYTLAVYDKNIVGLNENQRSINNTVKAEPNPATETVKLSWDKPLSGIISVYDGSGRLAVRHSVTEKDSVRFSLDGWAKGLYFVELRDHDAYLTGYSRFIVQ